MLTNTFNWNDATITVQAPNVYTRIKKWNYQTALNGTDIPDHLKPSEISGNLLFYLANTVEIEGDLGFSVPLENATPETLAQFVTEFAMQDDGLVLRWDIAVAQAKNAGNDPVLLPPEHVEKKDSKKKAS